MKKANLLFAISVTMFTCGLFAQQPGDLDVTFDTDGKLTTNVLGDNGARSIIIQPNGKIIVVGDAAGDFLIVRYNSDGTLDNNFGSNGNGKVTTDFSTQDDFAYSATMQTDGKIVVAGKTKNGTYTDIALARYNSNGTLDNSFGSNGKVITAFSPTDDGALSVAIQADGKIVIAGTDSYDFILVRYDANGVVDNSFGANGKVTTDFSGYESANSVVIQSDNKIVAAGMSGVGGAQQFGIARYNTDGTPDNSFGTNGKTYTGTDHRAHSMVIQTDGKILLAGRGRVTSNDDFALARYNSDGTLDNGFGTNGSIITAFFSPGEDEAYSVALQSDGKIVIAGFGDNGSNDDFAIARYNSDGTLDNSFNTDGKVITDFGFEDRAYAVAIQSDGKIVAAGSSNNGVNLALARYIGLSCSISVTSEPNSTSVSTGSTATFAVTVTPSTSTYQWQTNSGTGWQNVNNTGQYSGANSNTVSVSNVTITNNNQSFRCVVTSGNCSDTSNAATLTVITTSIEGNLSASGFLIYPNPIGQNAKLEYTLAIEEKLSIHLLDTQGRILKTFMENTSQSAGKHQQDVVLPVLPKGSYIIMIASANGSMSIKITKE